MTRKAPTSVALLLLVLAPSAQEPGPDLTQVHQRFQALKDALSAIDRELPTANHEAWTQKRRLLREFLASAPTTSAARSFRQQALDLMAAAALCAHDLNGAEQAFVALAEAADGPNEVEIRLRARHGLGQVAELSGDLEQAERYYREVADHPHGGQAGRLATTAMGRLRALRNLRPGAPCDDLPICIDLEGKPHDLGRSPRTNPVVLLYVSPLSDESVQAMRAYRRVMQPVSEQIDVLVVTITSDRRLAEKLSQKEAWTWPVLASGMGWLDPLALRFGVHKVPAAVLLGPRLQFIGGGLPPEELDSLLRQMIPR